MRTATKTTAFYFSPLLLALLAGCGDSKTLTAEQSPLAALPSLGSGATDVASSMDPVVESACEVWNKLPAQPTTESRYQVIADLSLGQSAEGNAILLGRHIPGHLPQLLYALSREVRDEAKALETPSIEKELAAQKLKGESLSSEKLSLTEERRRASRSRKREIDARLAQIKVAIPEVADSVATLRFRLAAYERKKVDPIGLDEFVWIAEKLYAKGELKTLEWGLLRAVAFFADFKYEKLMKLSREELIKQRNKAFVGGVEKILPGVFSGKPVRLSDSVLLADLFKGLGNPAPSLALVEALRPLEKSVLLFPSSSWADRASELRRVVRVLDRDEPKELSERACRYGLQTRLTAQLLTLKGFAGRPEVTAKGLLPRLETEDAPLLPEVLEPGTFGEPVTTPWVGAQMGLIENLRANYEQLRKDGAPVPVGERAKDTPRSRTAGTTDPFLESLAYLVEITSHRSDRVWDAGRSGAPGRTPVALLRMSFGLFGVAAGTLALEELEASASGVHLPRADSTQNFVRLIRLTRSVQKAYAPLAAPTDFDRGLLTSDQIEKFSNPENGVAKSFASLQDALILEAMRRRASGQGNAELTAELRSLGEELGNDYLRSLD